MAKENTPRPADKISADCPHCGFSQLESVYAKSTFCRKCGQHYSIEKLLAKEATSLKGPSLFDKLSKLVSGEKIRDICCFSCAHKMQVSSLAQSSSCSQCGSYIDLRDFKIAGPFGRSIQTQGEVIITSKGDVTSAKIACGAAEIDGKIRGNLVCTGTVRVRLQGKLLGGVETQQLVIDKKANVEFMRPVKAHAAEINGRISARIQCDGCVTIAKGGWLEGVIYARSINIEGGGIFSGEMFIGQEEPSQPELPATEKPAPAVSEKPRPNAAARGAARLRGATGATS